MKYRILILSLMLAVSCFGQGLPSQQGMTILDFNNLTVGTYLSGTTATAQSQISAAFYPTISTGNILIGSGSVTNMEVVAAPSIVMPEVYVNGTGFNPTNCNFISMVATNYDAYFQGSFYPGAGNPNTGNAASVGELINFPYYYPFQDIDWLVLTSSGSGGNLWMQDSGSGDSGIINILDAEVQTSSGGVGQLGGTLVTPTNTWLYITVYWNTTTGTNIEHIYNATNFQLLASFYYTNTVSTYPPGAIQLGQAATANDLSGATFSWGGTFISTNIVNSIGVTNIMAASPNEADVQAAINASDPGDTITIPSGSAIWTNTLVITNNLSFAAQVPGQTLIYDNVNRLNSKTSVMFFQPQYQNATNTISGLTFIGTNSTTTTSTGIIQLYLGGTWRVTGCLFSNLYNEGILIAQGAYGCIDHNTFDIGYATSAIEVRGGNSAATQPDIYGDTEWATPVNYGSTSNQVVIENNAFYDPSLQDYIDMEFGAETTFRFNQCTNLEFQVHGLDTSGRWRSGRSFEVYGNNFNYTSGGGVVMGLRGGTGVCFSNMISSGATLATLVAWRTTEPFVVFGNANGTNLVDTNSSTSVTGTTTSANGSQGMTNLSGGWTPNQWVGGVGANANIAYIIQDITQGGNQVTYTTTTGHPNYGLISSNSATVIWTTQDKDGNYMAWTNGDSYAIIGIIHAQDQTGLGSGNLIQDFVYGDLIPSNTVTHLTNDWPNEVSEPFYEWSNTITGSTTLVNIGGNTNFNDQPVIIQNRDYFDNVQKPGYTPLVYPDPLVGPPIIGPATPLTSVWNINLLRIGH